MKLSLLTDLSGDYILDLIRKNCPSLTEQSGEELATSAKMLCTHLVVAAIKKYKTFPYNQGKKVESTDIPVKYIQILHKIVLISMKCSQILVHRLASFKLKCSNQEKL
jgi:hypothetical protein